MSSCIYYHPDGFTVKNRQIMGRRVVGESFLNSYLRYRSSGDIWIQVEKIQHAKEFANLALELGNKDKVKVVNRENLSALKKPGCVFFSGPGLDAWAKYRAFYGDDQWSICGITHTTASAGAMDSIADLLVSPVQPWDALICTSRAVKKNVQRILDSQIDYLRHRFDCRKIVSPKLPIIPLGIDVETFSRSNVDQKSARKRLQLPEEALVVLFTGRLSFHSKANPYGMYLGLEQASKSTNKKIILLECGHFPNEEVKTAFSEAAKVACPSVRTIHVDGSKSEQFKLAWQVADIFCSLADNIQEAFGITPLEAMAAGLPVVVSDWDGYRDTVRDQIDGFRISTTTPPPGYGADLANWHSLGIARYDMYLGYTSSMTSVNLEELTHAFKRLFASADLRKSMGEAGKKNVLNNYDWKVIIPRYEELWLELNQIRKKAVEQSTKLLHPCPSRLDPFYAFEGYSTDKLLPETNLELVYKSFDESYKRYRDTRNLAMFAYVAKRMISDEKLISALKVLSAEGSCTVSSLTKKVFIASNNNVTFLCSLAWLLKMGIVKKVNIDKYS